MKTKSIEGEIDTVGRMVKIFCRGRHGSKGELCPGCVELLAYSTARLRHCPHEPKPACKDCPTHCYLPAMRARITEVMRYAGPRMFLHHPLLALKHYF